MLKALLENMISHTGDSVCLFGHFKLKGFDSVFGTLIQLS